MKKKYLVPVMPLRDGKVNGQDGVRLAKYYSDNGADSILIIDLSDTDEAHETNLHAMKEICRTAEIPVYAGGHIRRMEDVKKILYAGCSRAILNFGRESNVDMAEETAKRFGREKIGFSISDESQITRNMEEWGSLLLWSGSDSQCPYRGELPVISVSPAASDEAVIEVLSNKWVTGIAAAYFSSDQADFQRLKQKAAARGLRMHVLESSFAWEDLSPGTDGLIPVVVQDYKTLEVLMLAYMNEDAFDITLETGRMTYWSRSREELWTKGMTSGHFQYVKSLSIDCDNDTILARVSQVGAACHTGNRTCFYRDMVKKEYDEASPLKVFEKVYGVIMDRKLHPKEGSYTKNLLDKGLDKILKKIGSSLSRHGADGRARSYLGRSYGRAGKPVGFCCSDFQIKCRMEGSL